MTDFERAFALIDSKQETTIQRLRRIVGINTVVPPGLNYDTLVDYLEPQFQAAGFTTERVTVPPEKIAQIPLPLQGPRVNLVASRVSGRPEPVTIYAHMDVVPIEEGWTHDPFAGEVDDGRIYGRGVADMKGTIASLLTALDVMRELNLEPRYDMHVIICTDEEIGIYPGAKYLAEQGYVKGHILCMEGSQDPIERLCSAGNVDFTITTVGKSCHSGSNFMGVNAIEAMVPIMNELMALKQVVERRESESIAWPNPKAPSKYVTPMFNLDIIRAGAKSNIVPSACSLVVNRRFIPEERYEDVVAEVLAAVERGRQQSKALDVKVETVRAYPAVRYDSTSTYRTRMREAFKRAQGYQDADFKLAGGSGSTDMADIAEICRTDKFVNAGMGRQGESNAHGADESIRLSDLLAHTKELVWYLSE